LICKNKIKSLLKTDMSVDTCINTDVAKQNIAFNEFDCENIWHFAIVINKGDWFHVLLSNTIAWKNRTVESLVLIVYGIKCILKIIFGYESL